MTFDIKKLQDLNRIFIYGEQRNALQVINTALGYFIDESDTEEESKMYSQALKFFQTLYINYEQKMNETQLDRHNEVMLTCINASVKAKNDHPNDPKAIAFFNATMNWYSLPNEGEN